MQSLYLTDITLLSGKNILKFVLLSLLLPFTFLKIKELYLCLCVSRILIFHFYAQIILPKYF